MPAMTQRLRVCAVVVALLVLGVFFGLREHSIAGLHAEIDATREDQSRVEAANDELRARLERRDDLDYIEYLARVELGLIRPDEEKYLLITRPRQSADDGD